MNERLRYFGLNLSGDLIFIQTELQYFFDHAVLPVYSDYAAGIRINLVDYFPSLKQGYAFKRTVINLLQIYTEMHNLANSNNQYFITPDALMDAAFNDDIPAFWYNRSITMTDAIRGGLTSNYLNSFQVTQRDYANFDPKRISNAEIYRIVDNNSQNATQLPELHIIANNELVANAIIDEYSLSLEIENIMKFLPAIERSPERITVTSILKNLYRFSTNTLLNRLLADDRSNKLIYAIIISDPVMVTQYIDTYDPRDNNYEAYHLAVYYLEREQARFQDVNFDEEERNDSQQVIVDLIKAAIIERNLLEQKTFQTMMVPLGESDIPQTEMFHQYSRSLLRTK